MDTLAAQMEEIGKIFSEESSLPYTMRGEKEDREGEGAGIQPPSEETGSIDELPRETKSSKCLFEMGKGDREICKLSSNEGESGTTRKYEDLVSFRTKVEEEGLILGGIHSFDIRPSSTGEGNTTGQSTEGEETTMTSQTTKAFKISLT